MKNVNEQVNTGVYHRVYVTGNAKLDAHIHKYVNK